MFDIKPFDSSNSVFLNHSIEIEKRFENESRLFTMSNPKQASVFMRNEAIMDGIYQYSNHTDVQFFPSHCIFVRK